METNRQRTHMQVLGKKPLTAGLVYEVFEDAFLLIKGNDKVYGGGAKTEVGGKQGEQHEAREMSPEQYQKKPESEPENATISNGPRDSHLQQTQLQSDENWKSDSIMALRGPLKRSPAIIEVSK